jgi:membrane-associated phospholipid phosphatase
MSRKIFAAAAMVVAVLAVPVSAQTSTRTAADRDRSPASVDVVVAWNVTLVDALLASATAPQPGTRVGAIVQTAVFDAVNGITQRYAQYRPDALGTTAPRDASAKAAAVGAAYTALVALFPTQKATFDAQLTATLPQKARSSVDRGFGWGQTVANAILALRSTDGFTAVLSPYVAGALPAWQPVLPAFAGPVFRQFATMTPWAMSSPSQFLPAPPPALTSPRYAQDLSEVRSIGSLTSSTRTPDQTAAAQFWAGKVDTVATLWNRAADSLAQTGKHGDSHEGEDSGNSLTDHARLFALLNIGMADAVIAVWNAKNTYNTWRPLAAIANAGVHDSSETSPDTLWRPLLPTPPHQEFPSGHSGASAAATDVLAAFFGSHRSFSISSDGVPGAATTTRSYSSFSDAISEVGFARIAAGIHFRFACDAAMQMGDQVAARAMSTQLLPLHGDGNDDDGGND